MSASEAKMGTRRGTFTEKRYYEWHKDDVSITLREKSATYGGAAKH